MDERNVRLRRSGEEPRRYNGPAQAMHWLTAALMLAVLPLAWIATSLAREAPNKGIYFVLHKSVGLTILALAIARLLWRMVQPGPSEADLPKGLATIAWVSQWLLYAVLLIMPLSGYLLSAYGGRPTPYFWLFNLPGLEKDTDLHEIFERVHLLGQWVLYAFVLVHVAGALWHLAVRRDGVFDRMMPERREQRLVRSGDAIGVEARPPRRRPT